MSVVVAALEASSAALEESLVSTISPSAASALEASPLAALLEAAPLEASPLAALLEASPLAALLAAPALAASPSAAALLLKQKLDIEEDLLYHEQMLRFFSLEEKRMVLKHELQVKKLKNVTPSPPPPPPPKKPRFSTPPPLSLQKNLFL